jgi:hypothetical protein|eukprot:COSAG02_NODE_5454_length_4303_cov_5.503330_3_plen_75_part_00
MTSGLTDGTAESEISVVRPLHGVVDVGVLYQWHYRAKLFFVNDTHALLHVGKNRWLVKETLRHAWQSETDDFGN